MKTLIVGAGALGGLFAARLLDSGAHVALATRDAASAAAIRASGLRVVARDRTFSVAVSEVAPLAAYGPRDAFELAVIATKAHDALAVAPALLPLLAPEGVLLPIQNGGVARILGDQLGEGRVLGALSNIGASVTAPGLYEQRNDGHLLVGELAGGASARAERVGRWLGRAIDVRVSTNLGGAVWSKLLVNCSVTTIGAIAGATMREYVATPDGRELFERTYDEALAVALAAGARPERMIVEPVPPGGRARGAGGAGPAGSAAGQAWLGEVLRAYGDVTPSMSLDFARGRRTEVDFINGYVARVGRHVGVPVPLNDTIVEIVGAITRAELQPGPALVARALRALVAPVANA
jgi:2-dehydropantoate 2-reductase